MPCQLEFEKPQYQKVKRITCMGESMAFCRSQAALILRWRLSKWEHVWLSTRLESKVVVHFLSCLFDGGRRRNGWQGQGKAWTQSPDFESSWGVTVGVVNSGLNPFGALVFSCVKGTINGCVTVLSYEGLWCGTVVVEQALSSVTVAVTLGSGAEILVWKRGSINFLSAHRVAC